MDCLGFILVIPLELFAVTEADDAVSFYASLLVAVIVAAAVALLAGFGYEKKDAMFELPPEGGVGRAT